MNDTDLREFILARIDEDEQRAREGELPWLDEAERRGRLRILRTDDGDGLILAPGPNQAQDQRAPVPFAEKAPLLRREVEHGPGHDTLVLLASAYDHHMGWQEEWRT